MQPLQQESLSAHSQGDMSSNSSSSFSRCHDSRTRSFYASFSIIKALLLVPVSVFVLHLGLQRWRQLRSGAATSHFDVFAFHMTALEMIHVFGIMLFTCGMYAESSAAVWTGFYVYAAVFPGTSSLHALTCVERYLAVVHPVTYLRLRQSGGVKVRNISVLCVWLLCLGWLGASLFKKTFVDSSEPVFCVLTFSLIVVSFCSLRVLCVLIRPGPGEGGGARERVDHSKRRAFRTMMAVLGALWLWFVGFLLTLVVTESQLLTDSDACVMVAAANWFNLPSNLVLPVLFLHRAGKLTCCR